jgi:hypothetical protein
VQLDKSGAPSHELSVYSPFFIVPDSALTAPPPPVVVPPPTLTSEQSRTTVTIKGDNAEGSGFLMRSPDGTFVVTHLDLLAANPNVKVYTSSGAPITVLAYKGALDRDVALLSIRDDNYSYLPLATDATTSVQPGDQVLIPDLGQQNGSLSGTPGKIRGMAPDRLDFDNVLSPGCGGAPVVHVPSGKALALVTSQSRVDVSAVLAKAWAANPAPGASRIIPYYGLPLYSIQKWETYDMTRFLMETAFLKQFHQNTRCLDSFLNGRRRYGEGSTDDASPPDSRYYLNNPKLSEANDSYKQMARGSDRNQQVDAANQLLFDLDNIADNDVRTLQNGTNLYAYNLAWAQKELAYRKAIRAELDDLSNNIPRLQEIARTR